MIENLIQMLPMAKQRLFDGLPERFAIVTLHRPPKVDDAPWLGNVIAMVERINHDFPVIFPIRPRTRKRLRRLAETGLTRHVYD